MSDVETASELKKARELIEQHLEDGDIKQILDILKRIGNLSVNESLLRTTGIGIYVNKLRAKLDNEGADLAKKVVLKWKEQVQQSSKAVRSNSTDNPMVRRPSNPIVSAKSPSTPKPVKVASVPKPVVQRVRPKERTPEEDGLTVIPYDDPYRRKVCDIMYSALALGNTIDGDILLPLAIEIEKTVYENCTSVNDAYRTRIATLNFNLRDAKNPELNERVLAKTLTISQLCVMTSEELASETKKKQKEDMKKTSLFKSQGAASAQAETDMFKCGKCKQRKCTYFQKQTRSADEPMTTFVTCVNCDNHWKFC